MKKTSTNLANHLAQPITTLATCWLIQRSDGVKMGFTDHDMDIEYDGTSYMAASGFTPSSVANNLQLAVDNMDVQGVIDSQLITEQDIHAGKYDYGQIEIFMLNYNDTQQGKLNLRTGWLGEISYNSQNFTAEVRGLMQNLAQGIGQLYSPACRARLGDDKCQVDLTTYQAISQVTNITNNQEFIGESLSESDGWYDNGVIEFTSGNNNGLAMEIKTYKAQQINLVMAMPYDINIGDEFNIIAGCDKTIQTCSNKFNNVINFRGEPHVPGIDKMLQTAGTRNN